MPDVTFENELAGLVREYAQGGVRPIDRFAIAEATILHGRPMPRWRRGFSPVDGRRVLRPLLVGLLLAALVGGALVGSRLLRPPQPLRTYVGEFVSAPDLSIPVSYPKLAVLADGRVLVIGHDGVDGMGSGSTALIYDPATGVSEATGELLSSATLDVDAAVSLHDGRVLVIGSALPQVFDPTTRRFVPTGPMLTPRRQPGVAVLPDGRVLITGGTPVGADAATSSAELFDPASMTFSATAGMTATRAGGAMAVLGDGRVFVAPGASRYTVEVYDPGTGTFSDAGQLSAYGFDDAIALPDGRVVILGGFSLGDHGFADVWDPASPTVRVQRDLPGWVTGASLLDDGRVLLVGGRQGNWSGIYDPTTQATTLISPTRAWKPSLLRLADGRVLLIGGDAGGNSCCSWPAGVPTVQIFQ